MQQVVNKTHKEDIYRSYANLIGKSGTAELKMKQGETGRQIGWFISYLSLIHISEPTRH
ncbi:hypothetical protein JMUB7552_27610 [Staphylococcus aureus]